MKLSKEELKAKIGEKITDEDLKIELLEDIEDSFVEPDTTAFDELNGKYEELRGKYRDRFFPEKKEVDESENTLGKEEYDTEDEDEESKKIIDVKEI